MFFLLNIKNSALFAEKIFGVRQLASHHLPINHSLMRLDLLLIVLKESNARDLTVKKLFASFTHSHTGLRYNYRQLILEGWIRLESDDIDKRRKIVRPTKKLKDSFYNLIIESLILF